MWQATDAVQHIVDTSSTTSYDMVTHCQCCGTHFQWHLTKSYDAVACGSRAHRHWWRHTPSATQRSKETQNQRCDACILKHPTTSWGVAPWHKGTRLAVAHIVDDSLCHGYTKSPRNATHHTHKITDTYQHQTTTPPSPQLFSPSLVLLYLFCIRAKIIQT